MPLWLVVIIDGVLINLGYLLAYYLRFGWDVPARNITPFLQLAPFITVITLAILASLGLYTVKRYEHKDLMRLVGSSMLLAMVANMALAFWLRDFALPRGVLAVTVMVQFVLLSLWRSYLLFLEKKAHGEKKLLIIGNENIALPDGWFSVKAVLPPGSMQRIRDMLPEVDVVLMAGGLKPEERHFIMRASMPLGCEVFMVQELYEILLQNAYRTQFADTPVLEISPLAVRPGKLFIKRCLDICLAVPAFLVLLPVMGLASLAVKLSSPGPVFYRQKRVGLRGEAFYIYKIRSMVTEAEENGPVLACVNDPRITKVGSFLRATRMDELPQLINVIKGEMSLVGPRPERPKFVGENMEEMEEYRYRLLVKPGMTGLAQVSAGYATSVKDKLRYDLEYIVNYSLLLDFKILMLTIPTLLNKEAAAGKTDSVSVRD